MNALDYKNIKVKADMELLITGPVTPWFSKVVSTVLSRDVDVDHSRKSFSEECIFKTKYFTNTAKVNVFPITDICEVEWASMVMAKLDDLDVQSLILFVKVPNESERLTEEKNLEMLEPVLENIASYCVVPTIDRSGNLAAYDDAGLEQIELEEVIPEIHSAMCELEDLKDISETDDFGMSNKAPENRERDIQDIYDELYAARNSKTMTRDEKLELVNRITAELLDE